MFPAERLQRLKFLGLAERDTELLRGLRPVVERHAAAVVDAFYDHLLAFPETAELLRDRTTVERLKRLQREYLARLTEGTFDDAYFEHRLRIGKAHERVGLAPHWYLATYSHYFGLLASRVFEHFATNSATAQETMLALEKVFMLDASLAMDAYITSDRYRHVLQLESIVNESADGIFMLDNEKRFRAWNRAAERIFGWTAADVLGKHANLIVPPDLLKGGELARIDTLVQRDGFCHLDTERQAHDGTRVPVELTVSTLRDPQGNPIGRSVIVRDITERRRLAEAKLQAERLATIGAMSAKLAHEIRNPLSSITLNLDLVQDEIDTLAAATPAAGAEARSLLKSLGAEVRRIQRVTEDYLQFARLPKLQREPVRLNEALAQGLSFMQSLFDTSAVKLVTEFDAGLTTILGDENQLWQAVLNLVRNALEAMPHGGTLTVGTRRHAGGVTLWVSDTGKGLTAAEQRQLFKPFFSTKPGGTGLGLPLCQQVVIEHGGNIHCESTPGQGATFCIELPPTVEN